MSTAQSERRDMLRGAQTVARAVLLVWVVGAEEDVVHLLGRLGLVHFETGAMMVAEASLANALALFREFGIAPGEAEVLNTMGELSLAAPRARCPKAPKTAPSATEPMD